LEGLENDEIDFLEAVAKQREEQEEEKEIEERILLMEYKSAMIDRTKVTETETVAPPSVKKPFNQDKPKTQKQMLAGLIRKKPKVDDIEPAAKKAKCDNSPTKVIASNDSTEGVKVLLPGIGTYSDSDQSDNDD